MKSPHLLIVKVSITLSIFSSCTEEPNEKKEKTKPNIAYHKTTDTVAVDSSDFEFEKAPEVKDTIITSIVLKENDWKKLGLKGKVKKLKKVWTALDEDNPEDLFWSISEAEYFYFNPSGYLDKIEEHAGMTPNWREDFQYIYDGNQLTHRTRTIYGDGYYEDSTDWEKEKYFYNKNNQLVKIKIAGIDQKLRNEVKFKYDSLGRLIRKTKYDLSGDKVFEYTYQFTPTITTYKNFKNNFIQTSYFKDSQLYKVTESGLEDNIIEKKFEYDYDNQGNWVSLKHYVKQPNDEWVYLFIETQDIEYFK